jgi:hypothetical protein
MVSKCQLDASSSPIRLCRRPLRGRPSTSCRCGGATLGHDQDKSFSCGRADAVWGAKPCLTEASIVDPRCTQCSVGVRYRPPLASVRCRVHTGGPYPRAIPEGMSSTDGGLHDWRLYDNYGTGLVASSAGRPMNRSISFVRADLWRRTMRRHVGPSSAWAAKYVLVLLLTNGILTIAGMAAQPAATSNATAGPSARRGVTKPSAVPRNPAENKGPNITPVQPGSRSAPSVMSKPPQLKLPTGAATTTRSVVGPSSPGAVLGTSPRPNNPMVFAKPNTGTSGATSKSGIVLSPSSAHVSGTGVSLRGVAPASIRPGAKTNAGINGTGIVRKN